MHACVCALCIVQMNFYAIYVYIKSFAVHKRKSNDEKSVKVFIIFCYTSYTLYILYVA